MYKKLILSLILGTYPLLCKASSLSSFAQPKKKPVAKAKPTTRIKTIIKKQEPLKNAVLIELPCHKSLVRKFSPDELQTRDQKAIELLLEASATINPDITKAQKISKKSFQELSQSRDITMQSNLEQRIPFSNFVFNSRSKAEAINLINSLVIQLEQDYKDFQTYYTERYERDHKLEKSKLEAENRLINVAGISSVTQLEALIKGGRQ